MLMPQRNTVNKSLSKGGAIPEALGKTAVSQIFELSAENWRGKIFNHCKNRNSVRTPRERGEPQSVTYRATL